MLTTVEAAAALGVTEIWVRKLCRMKRIGRRFGNVWVITDRDIASYQANRRRPGRPKSGQN
jgi:hypothetical protein